MQTKSKKFVEQITEIINNADVKRLLELMYDGVATQSRRISLEVFGEVSNRQRQSRACKAVEQRAIEPACKAVLKKERAMERACKIVRPRGRPQKQQ